MSSAPRDRKGYTSKWMSSARRRSGFCDTFGGGAIPANLAKAKSSTSADVEFASAEDEKGKREEAFISGVARLAGNGVRLVEQQRRQREEEYRAGPGLSESLLKEILGDVVVSDKEARAKRESRS